MWEEIDGDQILQDYGYYGTYIPSDVTHTAGGFVFNDYPEKESGINAWRSKWVKSGYKWFSKARKAPIGWNPKEQLDEILKDN
ncbi:hypothetical protein [Breznakia pachnodae]|uniref:Uncharacterized protein n=1 Tax=Breznakia pachnodae TaxID=265178 RepID=A0ABU0E175_9FIRM|nr:hypothetical protein [Breznakia pachnodae]MDQ0360624.1 hypothetical protein [Breznakia pachnodae]